MTRYEHVRVVERLRIERGLPQAEVARDCGVDQRTLRYIEQGRRVPRLPVLFKLAEFFGVEPAWLLNEIRSEHEGNTDADSD